MNGQPLVSVIVITYNSAKTVIDTLDSISKQTYKNIELIVSDDCSRDDTIDIVESWMSNHRQEFVNTKLLTVDKNTGTTSNCNRGYRAATGTWVKGVAGDDRLRTECIERMVDYASKFPEIDIFCSKVQGFNSDGLVEDERLPFHYAPFNLNPEDFLFLLTCGNFLPAPGKFIKLQCYNDLGGYDENIKLMEDWPFWIKAAYNKKNIKLIEERLVDYRVSDQSISLRPNKSQAYIDTERQALNYALSVQRKIGFWYWLWGVCSSRSIMGSHNMIFYRYLRYLNPMSFKIRRILAYLK